MRVFLLHVCHISVARRIAAAASAPPSTFCRANLERNNHSCARLLAVCSSLPAVAADRANHICNVSASLPYPSLSLLSLPRMDESTARLCRLCRACMQPLCSLTADTLSDGDPGRAAALASVMHSCARFIYCPYNPDPDHICSILLLMLTLLHDRLADSSAEHLRAKSCDITFGDIVTAAVRHG